MCGGKGGKVNTQPQQTEAQRQQDLLLQQAETRRQQELAAAERRRQEEAARAQAQYDAMLAENRRRDDATQAQLAAERQAREAEAVRQRQWEQDQAQKADAAAAAAEAKRAAEAAAVQRAADERAGRMRDYSTGRQTLIDDYSNQIAAAFGGFDDGFYDKFKGDYVSAAAPALQEQYGDDQKTLVYAFTDSGNLDSTAAADRFARLDKLQAQRQAKVASDAEGAAQNLRTSVNQNKNDALATAFASGAVGKEDLPDGVTDVSGELGAIGSRLTGLVGDVRKSASRINAPTFDASSLSNLALAFNAPNKAANTYGRFGGTTGNQRSLSLGRSSYTVS